MSDLLAYTNHFLSQMDSIHNVARMAHGIPTEDPPEILKWVECEECGGQGYSLIWVGTDARREEVESQCQDCDGGYVRVDEGDSRWDEGTYAHPRRGPNTIPLLNGAPSEDTRARRATRYP